MINLTLDAVKRVEDANPDSQGVTGGRKALRLLASDLRGTISPKLAAPLVWFALPLAARRSLDAAGFLTEAANKQLVRFK